jgi:alpha-L-rhamnosidase
MRGRDERATRLRVEHLGDGVLGLGERRPRLSWRQPHGAVHQYAYCVEIDGCAHPRVESAESVLAPWPTDPLGSRYGVEWRVKVWTDADESAWSAPA